MEFRVGDSIEVCNKEEGFEGSYYAATIIKPVVWNKKSKNNTKYLVEYKNLLSDDGKHLHRQVFDVSDLRPSPPEFKVSKFELYDAVDAFHNDGWWDGVIVSRNRCSKYTVYFFRTGENIEYSFSQLRVHQYWKNGEWVPSQTYPGMSSVPSQTYPKQLFQSNIHDKEDDEIERAPMRTVRKVFTRDSIMPKYVIETTSSNANANANAKANVSANANAKANVSANVNEDDHHEIERAPVRKVKKIFTRDSIRPKYVIETTTSIIETTTSNVNAKAKGKANVDEDDHETERESKQTIKKIFTRTSVMPETATSNGNDKRSRSGNGDEHNETERVPMRRMKKIFTRDSIMPKYVIETTPSNANANANVRPNPKFSAKDKEDLLSKIFGF